MGDSKFGFGSGVCRSLCRIVDDGKIGEWLKKNTEVAPKEF